MRKNNIRYRNTEIIKFTYESNKNYKYKIEKKLNPKFIYIAMDFNEEKNMKRMDLLTELGELGNIEHPFHLELQLANYFNIPVEEYDESMEEYIIEKFIKRDIIRKSLTIVSNMLIKTNEYNPHHILKLF